MGIVGIISWVVVLLVGFLMVGIFGTAIYLTREQQRRSRCSNELDDDEHTEMSHYQ